jgi:alkanesulfonate monooxygenase
LQLRPRLPAALLPEVLIAGQSDDVHRISMEMECSMMQMLPPNLDEGISAPGLSFGIFAREDRDQARQAAKLRFLDSPESRELLKLTMENTDSVLKRGLNEAGQTSDLYENGYWHLPFLTFQADCPYLVGSYAEIGVEGSLFSGKERRHNHP